MVLQNVACAHAPSDRTLNGSESEDVRASPWGSFLMSQVDNCHFPAVWTPHAAVWDHRWLCEPSTLETNNGHLCMFYMILTSCHAWIKWHKFELRFLFRQPPERSRSTKAVEPRVSPIAALWLGWVIARTSGGSVYIDNHSAEQKVHESLGAAGHASQPRLRNKPDT